MKSLHSLFQKLCLGMILISVISSGSTGWAQPPLPKDKTEIFQNLEKKIEAQKEEADRLKQQEKEETEKLTELQHTSVQISRNIQKQETLLDQLSSKIAQNEIRQTELEQTLDENRVQLAEHLSAAIRMRRIPAETLLLQANSPITTAQTALILQEAIPGIQSHMEKVSLAANELMTVQQTLLNDKRSQETALQELREEENKLASLIEERQELIKKTQQAYLLTQKDIEKLTEESKSLQELVSKISKINEERMKEAKRQAAQRNIPPPAPPPAIPADGKSPAGWPAAGVITIHYGENDLYGAPSQGIKIRTRSAALVTTPLSGTVRYAGEFKNYGQLVIIEHNNGWHSLIAGLHQINALVGQTLQSGEPVGHMSRQKKQPVLYYELRYNGKPVNPAKRIKELS
jgi:murein hydrolase activator